MVLKQVYSEFIVDFLYNRIYFIGDMTDKQNLKEIEKTQIGSKLGSFLDSFIVDVLLFIAASITLVVT